MKRMQKECIICGKEKPFYGWTGYTFFADGTSRTTGWCTNHEKEFSDYANPTFENQQALELFKRLHPIKYSGEVKNKPLLFLDRFQKELAKNREPLYSKEELDHAEKELQDAFQRVRKEQEASP